MQRGGAVALPSPADALIVAGAEVADIMSATTVKPTVLHKHANVRDGHLTYPPQA